MDGAKCNCRSTCTCTCTCIAHAHLFLLLGSKVILDVECLPNLLWCLACRVHIHVHVKGYRTSSLRVRVNGQNRCTLLLATAPGPPHRHFNISLILRTIPSFSRMEKWATQNDPLKFGTWALTHTCSHAGVDHASAWPGEL